MKAPWDRDDEDYTVLNAVLLAALTVIMCLAVCREWKPVGKSNLFKPGKQITFVCTHSQFEAGECAPETGMCYIMSDNHAVCKPIYGPRWDR